MPVLDASEKLRDLAKANTGLQAYFGAAGLFRWFSTQLPQGYYPNTSIVVTRVSTLSSYVQQGPLNQSFIRFQFTVYDPSLPTARAAAKAVIDWLDTISLAENGPTFVSHPNFSQNQRETLEPQLQPPAQVVSFDFKMWNKEN